MYYNENCKNKNYLFLIKYFLFIDNKVDFSEFVDIKMSLWPKEESLTFFFLIGLVIFYRSIIL